MLCLRRKFGVEALAGCNPVLSDASCAHTPGRLVQGRMKRLGMKRLVPDALHPSLCGMLPFLASDGSWSLCGLGTGLRFTSCCYQISELPLKTSLTITLRPWLVNRGRSRGISSADMSALVQMQPLASQDPLDLGFV